MIWDTTEIMAILQGLPADREALPACGVPGATDIIVLTSDEDQVEIRGAETPGWCIVELAPDAGPQAINLADAVVTRLTHAGWNVEKTFAHEEPAPATD